MAWRPGGGGAHVDALLAVAVADRSDGHRRLDDRSIRHAYDAHTQEEEQGSRRAAEPQQEGGKYRQRPASFRNNGSYPRSCAAAACCTVADGAINAPPR
jgi:hypothetical protein